MSSPFRSGSFPPSPLLKPKQQEALDKNRHSKSGQEATLGSKFKFRLLWTLKSIVADEKQPTLLPWLVFPPSSCTTLRLLPTYHFKTTNKLIVVRKKREKSKRL